MVTVPGVSLHAFLPKANFALVLGMELMVLGCARTTTKLGSLTPEQRGRLTSMRVLSRSELEDRKVRYLGTVQGLSCQVGTLDTPPSEEEAARDVKMRAAIEGANALADLLCESSGVSWAHNCSSSISCYAEALVVADKRPTGKTQAPPPQAAPPAAIIELKKPASTGTGWMTGQGVVVTNWHVIEGRQKIELQFQDGHRAPAKVHARDTRNDVALLLPVASGHDTPGIPLASEGPSMGDTVFTIGFPAPSMMGQQPKLTSGVVSAVTGAEDDPRFIQMSVAVQPGNSGGPLLNSRGEAVGMVTSKLDPAYALKHGGFLPENVGYAIKIDYLRPLLRSAPMVPNSRELQRALAALPELAARIGLAIVAVEAE